MEVQVLSRARFMTESQQTKVDWSIHGEHLFGNLFRVVRHVLTGRLKVNDFHRPIATSPVTEAKRFKKQLRAISKGGMRIVK